MERRIVHGSDSESDLILLGLDLAPLLNGCDFGVGSALVCKIQFPHPDCISFKMAKPISFMSHVLTRSLGQSSLLVIRFTSLLFDLEWNVVTTLTHRVQQKWCYVTCNVRS